MADWNADAQLVGCSFARIVLRQALAQPVHLHADDRVGILIEGIAAAKHVERDRILLDLRGLASKRLFAEIRKEMREGGTAGKDLRPKHRLQFGALQLQVDRLYRCRRHPNLPAPNSAYTPLQSQFAVTSSV
jgi:hypothetical protein